MDKDRAMRVGFAVLNCRTENHADGRAVTSGPLPGGLD